MMMMVILHYPAVAPTLAEVRADKEQAAAFFENEVPGLIDKTWGMNEETGRMASVYHFEDKATAEQRSFRRANNASLEYFDVAAIAYTKPLREEATA
ncbi:MAG: YdhR family protein [Nitrospinae bacterium]|nr:YdhR family protein [Nitrospinota bacterium]